MNSDRAAKGARSGIGCPRFAGAERTREGTGGRVCVAARHVLCNRSRGVGGLFAARRYTCGACRYTCIFRGRVRVRAGHLRSFAGIGSRIRSHCEQDRRRMPVGARWCAAETRRCLGIGCNLAHGAAGGRSKTAGSSAGRPPGRDRSCADGGRGCATLTGENCLLGQTQGPPVRRSGIDAVRSCWNYVAGRRREAHRSPGRLRGHEGVGRQWLHDTVSGQPDLRVEQPSSFH